MTPVPLGHILLYSISKYVKIALQTNIKDVLLVMQARSDRMMYGYLYWYLCSFLSGLFLFFF